MQPWCTTIPMLNQTVFSCLILTVASCPACSFFFFHETGKVVWYSHIFKNFPHFVVIHTVKGCSVVNELEVDFFRRGGRFRCFFYDPKDVCNLISGSSAFSVWNFSIHVLLKPSLEDFEHYLASMWNQLTCKVFWTFFGIALFWDWNENRPFPILQPLLSFPNFLTYWMQHFNSIIF